MAQYRLSRNLEASLIEFFRDELVEDEWTGISVMLNIKQDKVTLPAIIIYVLDTDVQKKEIGSGTFLKFPTVVIRIFANNEGQRLDLADWVLEKLECNIPYYSHIISSGGVSTKTESGNVIITKVIRNEKEYGNTNPENLEKEDRFRHNITFSCYVGETS